MKFKQYIIEAKLSDKEEEHSEETYTKESLQKYYDNLAKRIQDKFPMVATRTTSGFYRGSHYKDAKANLSENCLAIDKITETKIDGNIILFYRDKPEDKSKYYKIVSSRVNDRPYYILKYFLNYIIKELNLSWGYFSDVNDALYVSVGQWESGWTNLKNEI